MSSGLFVCMVLWEPFIGCFIGGRLLCGICLTYSRQRPERSRMAIAEGCRLGGFLCPHAERTYGALRLPEITLSGFSRSVFRLFSIVCFARLYYVVGCFCLVSGCARSFRPIGRKRPKGAFPVIHALFSRLFRVPQIPVLSDSQPPECPQDEASDGGGQCQPTAGLPSPLAGSGGDDAAGRADDSRHNGRYVCRCAMFGHPVVAVACEGETKLGRGRCRFCGGLAGIAGRLGIFGIFGACRKRRGRLAVFPERGERSGSISGVGGRCRRFGCRWRRGCFCCCRWRCCCRRLCCCGHWCCRRFPCLCYCLYHRVCRLRGHLPALRFDAENAVEDMASLRSGTAPRRPVAGPDFRTEGGRCRNLRRCRGRFRFARVCCAFGRLPPLRNFRCIGRSESVLRCRVRCAAGAACCGPSCGSGLRVLRRASFLPARKTDGSKAASRAGICGFAAENRAAGQFGGRGVGPAFEVVDRDLRHDGRDGCAYGVFQRFVVGERRRARG